mgnify:CR=1 FL=1
MSEITLYDSRGYPLDDPNGDRNEKIRNMSRYGVVFTISYTQPYEMSTYFRAYESSSGRMEQYYATYTTSSNRALLKEFRESVIETAEREHGLEIERTESGENILSNLDTDDPGPVGRKHQLTRARKLLSVGERLRFGVTSYEKAFKLISDLSDARAGAEFAITEGDSTHGGPMEKYDLIVEKGPYTGLEPLGQTQALMNPESESSDDDETLLPTPTPDVAYDVAIAVLVVVLYLIVASLLFNPLGGPALPGAAEVPWSHDVGISFSDDGQTVQVTGESPAGELTLQYLNETNSTKVIDERSLQIKNKHNINRTNSPIPPNADSVRIQHQPFPMVSLTVAPKNGSHPRPESTTNTTQAPTNGSASEETATETPATNTTQVPTNDSADEVTATATPTTTTTQASTNDSAGEETATATATPTTTTTQTSTNDSTSEETSTSTATANASARTEPPLRIG